jgi:hypothetical protein
MSLADLIRGRAVSGETATATLATVATGKAGEQSSVAGVATVAVAASQDGAETVAGKQSESKRVSGLTPEQDSALRAWLVRIQETDAAIVTHLFTQCDRDAGAREYFLRQARR